MKIEMGENRRLYLSEFLCLFSEYLLTWLSFVFQDRFKERPAQFSAYHHRYLEAG